MSTLRSSISDESQSNIGWVYPPQPQTSISVTDQVVGILSGTTPLTLGQDYVDIEFGTEQSTVDWVLLGCAIVNLVDDEPLNIWPGVITEKTTTGFRLQLNGLPDTANYYLRWSIQGAFGFLMTGPTSGVNGVASTAFLVALPDDSRMTGSVVITPHSSGGGTFTPSTVTLTPESPSASFTFTPVSIGAKTISLTNDRAMSNPAAITYTVTALATSYTLSGPSTGESGVESTDFTVALPAMTTLPAPVTITPDDGGGGGTFTPTSVDLSTGASSATFTYTPASSGAKTISTTNSGTLTDPTPLTYTVAAGPLVDGDPVDVWEDSSGNGNDATMTGSNRPVYKTAIVNGKPVVRFSVAGASKLNLTTPISGNWSWTIFVVMKPVTAAASDLYSLAGNDGANPKGPLYSNSGNIFEVDRANYQFVVSPGVAAFHVLAAAAVSSGSFFLYIDGAVQSPTVGAVANTGDFAYLGWDGTAYSDGDIAEILIYNAFPAAGDFNNINAYLGAKYGITVSGGGSVIDPSSVSGLVGWWKADSL